MPRLIITMPRALDELLLDLEFPRTRHARSLHACSTHAWLHLLSTRSQAQASPTPPPCNASVPANTRAVMSELLHMAASCCTHKCSTRPPSLPHPHATTAVRPQGTQARTCCSLLSSVASTAKANPCFCCFVRFAEAIGSDSALLLSVREFSAGPTV